MFQYSNKLWVDLLSDKYDDGACLLYATTWPSNSTTWSTIIHAKNYLKSGLISHGAQGHATFLFGTIHGSLLVTWEIWCHTLTSMISIYMSKMC